MAPDTFQVIIPARYRSTRLPGKPLLDIAGKSMIQHVHEGCVSSNAAGVTVATDDERILAVVEGFGGVAVMTSANHDSGTDRIAEAADILGLDDSTVIVNVQGDEPDMPPELIDQVAMALVNDPQARIATASAPVDDQSQLDDPSVVKVVTNRHAHAMYFSRATIPHIRPDGERGNPDPVRSTIRRHLGIYAYRAGYIRRFSAMESCELEKLEKLEAIALPVAWRRDSLR